MASSKDDKHVNPSVDVQKQMKEQEEKDRALALQFQQEDIYNDLLIAQLTQAQDVPQRLTREKDPDMARALAESLKITTSTSKICEEKKEKTFTTSKNQISHSASKSKSQTISVAPCDILRSFFESKEDKKYTFSSHKEVAESIENFMLVERAFDLNFPVLNPMYYYDVDGLYIVKKVKESQVPCYRQGTNTFEFPEPSALAQFINHHNKAFTNVLLPFTFINNNTAGHCLFIAINKKTKIVRLVDSNGSSSYRGRLASLVQVFGQVGIVFTLLPTLLH
jgi:hypothetical protein